MRNAHRGYIRSGDLERDCVGCGHCTASVTLTPPKGCESKRIGRCGQCERPLCVTCEQALTQTLKCVTWEKTLEALERKDALRRAMGV